MFSTRPGCSRSHARSIPLITLRCSWSWEPHRSQGMIGYSRIAAQRAMSFSRVYASGRITTWRPSSERSFGGIVFSFAWWKRFRNSVSTMSSRWCPSATLVAPMREAKL